MFSKILVANRGEIACRVIRACKNLGIFTVAVYSDADKDSLHVRLADEAIYLGGSQPSESYLLKEKLIEAAKETGAEAIHPGYGFLSEKADFAELCEENGIQFIGPKSSVIKLLGPKIQAKLEAIKAGVPVVPGYEGEEQELAVFQKHAANIGYPVLLKASAGGGGRGMRIVRLGEELKDAFESAKREAESAFGDGKLLMEKYFESAKHIEVQVLGDNHGNYIHLFERECSVQRRYQKIIEESPSPSLSPEQRLSICESARALAASVGYNNAGTVEFLFAPDGSFYFLEVNTRLQVEHPVTEEVTQTDLVELQIRIASGENLSHIMDLPAQNGWAIECRICAEDPQNNFFPSTGRIGIWGTENNNLRLETGIENGSEISIFYDSMVAKFITWGPTREDARRKMLYQLSTFPLTGVKVNIDLLKSILKHSDFIENKVDTKWIERNQEELTQVVSNDLSYIAALASLKKILDVNYLDPAFDPSLTGWRNSFYQDQWKEIDVNGKKIKLAYKHGKNESLLINENGNYVSIEFTDGNGQYSWLRVGPKTYKVSSMYMSNEEVHIWITGSGGYICKLLPRFVELETDTKGSYTCPMPGEIVKILVQPGEKVESGQKLLILSSMKMESSIEANEAGIVKEIFVEEKQFVEAGKELLSMEDAVQG